ncbi:hypothetical protein G3444_15230 [Shewanella baltica]|uniref:hypothetical protein n=1 Tax=Shewanella baltica TaxID=62322 RepID=UPI00217D6CF8|nr:hypothetical protein [Shewanella baltica]MCS6120240.1 hypothetical protein [Shewanella baltica]
MTKFDPSAVYPEILKVLLSKSLLCISLKQTGFADAKQVSLGDLRDDRPPHGRSLASMPSWHL